MSGGRAYRVFRMLCGDWLVFRKGVIMCMAIGWRVVYNM